jgi:hypothetical protein
MKNLNKVPSRVKHYLLEYKDKNMEDYQSQFGTKKLNDLTLEEIKQYFVLATSKDVDKILSGHPKETPKVSTNKANGNVCVICGKKLTSNNEDDNCCDECWLRNS